MPLKTDAALRKDQTNAGARDVMQHRHFAIIAGIIAEHPDADMRLRMAEHFCDRLSWTNSSFNGPRFMEAALS